MVEALKKEKSAGQRLTGSFGGMNTVLSNLEEISVTKMQRIDRFWYNVVISRIQVKVRHQEPTPIYFLKCG